jgi:hypothetical protein
MSVSVKAMFFAACLNASLGHASRLVSFGGEGFAVDASLIQADANKQRSIAGRRRLSG